MGHSNIESSGRRGRINDGDFRQGNEGGPLECGIHQADGKERILAVGKGESKAPACENLTGERRERRASGMAWATCGGRDWERPQVRLENGFPQFVMDLGSLNLRLWWFIS